MPQLDALTPLTMTFSVTVIIAALTLMAALYGNNNKTLIYAGICWLLEACALAFYMAPYGPTVTIWGANIALLLAYGFIWASMRTFAGKKVPWFRVAAGAVIWAGLCLWPTFIQSLNLRIATFSILILSYMLASLRDMWPSWRQDTLGISPVMFFLAINSAFYFYRMIPLPATGSIWPSRVDMGVTIYEHTLFILGLSFSMLLMVRARTERHYQYASRHDDLTGLYNRRALFEQGAIMHTRTMDTGVSLAAVMCDLDWFKAINDQYGHAMGDKVLVLFSNVLLELAPERSICARLGGEEFLMLVPDTSPEDVQHLADTIHARLAEAMSSLPPDCTASIGISTSTSTSTDANDSLDHLITRADQALYAAKTAGRDCTQVWTARLANAETPNTRTRSSKDGRIQHQTGL